MASTNPLPISQQCGISPCLFRLAGAGSNDADAQISACQSIFGIPIAPTVTLPAEPIYSTVIETSTSYVDIVVSTSTVDLMVDQTSTSFATVTETDIDYTSTVTDTITTTATAAAVDKRHAGRRRRCRGRGTSSQPAQSTSSAPSFPSECDSQQDYSAACACLVPATVTSYSDAVTTIVFATEVSTVTVATEPAVTVDVTTVIVDPATTTLVTTLETQTTATVTTTATSAPVGTPVPDFSLFTLKITGDGIDDTLVVTPSIAGLYAAVVSSTGEASALSLTQGTLAQPSTANQLYIAEVAGGTCGAFVFAASAVVAGLPALSLASVTCSVDSVTFALSCSADSGFDHFWSCSGASDQELALGLASIDATNCVAVQVTAQIPLP